MKTLSEIIVLAANTENTPELVDFWLSRYQYLLANAELFRLHPATIEAMSGVTLTSPLTPVGEIFLEPHYAAQTAQFSISGLQDIIFTATRFLDSLLEVSNFDEATRLTVHQFRKIGLGIAHIGEFLDAHAPEDPRALIDDIGNFFSNSAYRASEGLAEEKGECDHWYLLKKTIRPKSFEKWINTENGSVYDGLFISANKSEQDILNSPFEIIARRNSHILLLPPEPLWKKWTDRDSSNENIRMLLEQKKNEHANVAATSTYEVGELVTVTKKQSPLYQKVVQVAQVPDLPTSPYYQVQSSEILHESEMFAPGELDGIDASKILRKIEKNIAVVLHLFVFNERYTQLMTTDTGSILQISLTPGTEIKTAITNALSHELQHFVDILQIDIASYALDHHKETLHLGCAVQLNKGTRITHWNEFSTVLEHKHIEPLLTPILAKLRVDERAAATIQTLQARNTELELVAQVSELEVQKNSWTTYFDTVSAMATITLSDTSTVECSITRTKQRLTKVSLKAVQTESSSIRLFCSLATIALTAQTLSTNTVNIPALMDAVHEQGDTLITELTHKLEQLLAA
jgi:hypothetical protein